jgi:hypothetical protein
MVRNERVPSLCTPSPGPCAAAHAACLTLISTFSFPPSPPPLCAAATRPSAAASPRPGWRSTCSTSRPRVWTTSTRLWQRGRASSSVREGGVMLLPSPIIGRDGMQHRICLFACLLACSREDEAPHRFAFVESSAVLGFDLPSISRPPSAGSPTLGGHMPTQVQVALGAVIQNSQTKVGGRGGEGGLGGSSARGQGRKEGGGGRKREKGAVVGVKGGGREEEEPSAPLPALNMSVCVDVL